MTPFSTSSLPSHLTSATPPMTAEMLRLKRLPRDVVARYVDGAETPSLIWIGDTRRAARWLDTPGRQRLGIMAKSLRAEAERLAVRNAPGPTSAFGGTAPIGRANPHPVPQSRLTSSAPTAPRAMSASQSSSAAPSGRRYRPAAYHLCHCGGYLAARSGAPRVIRECNGHAPSHHDGEIPGRAAPVA